MDSDVKNPWIHSSKVSIKLKEADIAEVDI